MADGSVRVRFAPSPTGLLHIGGLRTALYNYLFARKHDGDFLLRIEDTDQERYVEDAEQNIIEALTWTGLSYDEGPEVGGDYGPYRQSERSDHYREYAQTLVEAGAAYYAFDTEEELEALREQAGDGATAYDASTRRDMRNSLTMDDDEVARKVDDGNDHVVRLKVPRQRTIHFQDEVRGGVTFDSEEVDDQVLLKSDGLPTYHLANVVDDHLMEISHVIRGEEWLSSTPKHVLMYEALGWEPPTFAHLPLIMSPDGGKLSKRDADRLGIPVYVTDYKEAGYEPEGLLNFLALLGWNPGTEQELFALDEMAEAFSLERVGTSGVQFDLDKLRWVNEHYVRDLSVDELADRARPVVEEEGYEVSDDRLRTICDLVQERIQVAPEVVTNNRYFFEDPETYEEEGVQKRWKDESADLLLTYADRLEDIEDSDTDIIETELRDLADEEDVGAGAIIHPARLSVSGRSYGPGVFGLMAAVGREACIRRMRRAAEELG
ncbi:MAG: glutamate--tRNA ligase [Bacteroidetes bacterium SW_9_63_38]|nr:MAG: glutamate--tRNA ligase [Bacteroidetes bacterium SW_9_63_38]